MLNRFHVQPQGHTNASLNHTNDNPQTDLLDLIEQITGTHVDYQDDTRLPIAQRFERFHAANPAVYTALRILARQWKNAGRQRLGIAALFERLRWEIGIRTEGDPWKCNNDYRSFYARKLMAENADLDGLFETRRSAADQWIADRDNNLGRAA